MAREKIQVGKNGEEKGAHFLQEHGYTILERNYRCRLGEIDIIALDKDCVVFVEVKTRKTQNYGLPEESVNWHKQQKIEKAALHWLKTSKPPYSNFRFDVLSIGHEGIKLFKDAFQASGKYVF